MVECRKAVRFMDGSPSQTEASNRTFSRARCTSLNPTGEPSTGTLEQEIKVAPLPPPFAIPPPRHGNSQTQQKTTRSIPPPPPHPNTYVLNPNETPTKDCLKASGVSSAGNLQVTFSSPQTKLGIVHGIGPSFSGRYGLTQPKPSKGVSPLSHVKNIADGESTAWPEKRWCGPQNTTLDSIHMLNFEFIEMATSLQDLHRIIRLLSEQENESPQLLKAAKKRLLEVRKTAGIIIPPPPPPCYRISPSPHNRIDEAEVSVKKEDKKVVSPLKDDCDQAGDNISRITAGNTTLDSIDPTSSSLNFSLSPSSTLHGVTLVEPPTVPDHFFFRSQNGQPRLVSIPESFNSNRKFSSQPSPKISRSDLVNSLVHRNHGRTEEQEETFKTVVDDLKQQLLKATAERDQCKARTSELMHDHEATRITLDLTRAAFCKKDEETRKIEKRLESKITELSRALASTAERSRLVVKAEKFLRTQCEEELTKQNRKNVVLNKELRETRDTLEEVKRRHLKFRLELLKATGASKFEIQSLSQQEFVSYLTGKIKAMQQDNEGMSRTLVGAKKAIQVNSVLKNNLDETNRANRTLEVKNAELAEKVRELRAEVQSSRAYIDKLLKTSHDTREEGWENQEALYKNVIHNLRQQIREQKNPISIELYKSAVEESQKKLAQLRIAENSIGKLQQEVSQLRIENEKASNKNHTPRGTVESKSRRSVLFSPADQLEKGNLFRKSHPINAINDKSPVVGDGPSIATKQTKTSYLKSENEDIKSCNDLTGITISFDAMTTPGAKTGLKSRYKGSQGVLKKNLTNKNGLRAKQSPYQKKTPEPNRRGVNKANENRLNDAYRFPEFDKESNPKTPRSASKEVRERFGGAKLLQDKLRKMRSPKMMGPGKARPLREVQVIFH